MSIPIKSDPDFNFATLKNIKFQRVNGSGSAVDEVRIDANGYVVTWNGSTWVAPAAGSLPIGTADGILGYDLTTSAWVNRENCMFTQGTNTSTLAIRPSNAYAIKSSLSTNTTSAVISALYNASNNITITATTAPQIAIKSNSVSSGIAFKIISTSTDKFTISYAGAAVGQSLQLRGLAGYGSGLVGMDNAGTLQPAGSANIMTNIDYNFIRRTDNTTMHVSGSFPTPVSNNHFATIDEAVTQAHTAYPNVLQTVVIHPGEYAILNPIPAHVRIECMPGVKIMNSVVRLSVGGQWVGNADVSADQGSCFKIAQEDTTNRTPTVINGNEIRVLAGGVRLHIKCNILRSIIMTPSSAIGTLISNFDVQVDCLELGNVFTTRVDIESIDGANPVTPVFNAGTNTYCVCEWKKNVASCPQSKTCLMSSVGMAGAIIRDTDKCKMQIRCNKRLYDSQLFVSIGKIDISGLRSYMDAMAFPVGYVVGLDTGSMYKSSVLRLANFREKFDDVMFPYQIANDGVIIFENMNIENTTLGGSIVSLNREYDIPCWVSIADSRLFSITYEVMSNGSNDTAVIRNSVLGYGFYIVNIPVADFIIHPTLDWI